MSHDDEESFHSVFWNDHEKSMQNPEYRHAYETEKRKIRELEEKHQRCMRTKGVLFQLWHDITCVRCWRNRLRR